MQKRVNPEEIIDKVSDELSPYDIPDDIEAIYIYGSILKGRLRAESDIDIAILPNHRVNEMKALELISKTESLFTKIFKKFGISNEVSVLNMRGKYVSIELLYNIILNGLCIYEKNRIEHLEFKNFVIREYLDFKPFLEKLRAKKYGFV